VFCEQISGTSFRAERGFEGSPSDDRRKRADRRHAADAPLKSKDNSDDDNSETPRGGLDIAYRRGRLPRQVSHLRHLICVLAPLLLRKLRLGISGVLLPASRISLAVAASYPHRLRLRTCKESVPKTTRFVRRISWGFLMGFSKLPKVAVAK
jgi:hypothetical protein